MPKMTMSKSSKGAAKHFPVKVTTMDAELEFEIEVSMNVLWPEKVLLYIYMFHWII